MRSVDRASDVVVARGWMGQKGSKYGTLLAASYLALGNALSFTCSPTRVLVSGVGCVELANLLPPTAGGDDVEGWMECMDVGFDGGRWSPSFSRVGGH